ncbi:MAG: UDP-N-acetylmuramate--L-alanine ligase [Cyanobacteria bacterium J06638_22]
MKNAVDLSGKPFHFIGIGGIGMSALAYVLAKRNLPVSGSDICLNEIMTRLEQQGADIYTSQAAANLDRYRPITERLSTAAANGSGSKLETVAYSTQQATSVESAEPVARSLPPLDAALSTHDLPQVICSTAIHDNNSEFRAAQAMGCPIYHRSDLLAALMQEYEGIAIAGTHGKTTTSSMTGFLLLKAGLDPTIVVGGEVEAWGGNAYVGHGPHLVAEADESDGSLIKHHPKIGVITNIELDHPDHYTSLDEVIHIFQQFAEQCGVLVGSWDCDVIRQHIPTDISYSLNPQSGADYIADQIVLHAEGVSARIWEQGQVLGTIRLGLLGRHNLSNALAAIAIGRKLGLGFDTIADILPQFVGARRRFEHRGEAHNIVFVDDYAHHPSEIHATLAAASLRVQSPNSSQNRLVAVFQPHRYSRTKAFWQEFAQAFGDADWVIASDIYSAGEPNAGSVSGEGLAQAIAQYHDRVDFCPTLAHVTEHLKQILKPGDLVLFLGAGNLNRVIPDLLTYYQSLDLGTLMLEATS